MNQFKKTTGSHPNAISTHKKLDFFTTPQDLAVLSCILFTDKIKKVTEGLHPDFVVAMKELLGVDYSTLAYMLSVTERSLYLKKGKETFSPAISEKLLAILEIYSFAQRVLGDRDYVLAWMQKNNKALGDKPVMLMNTLQGMDAVREEIRRLETGAF